MFYERDIGHIILKIVLIDVKGYYKEYKDNGKYDTKKMNFKLDDDLSNKVIDIFDNIEKKLGIDLDDYPYEAKEVKNILKQQCLIKHTLEKIRIKRII